MSYNNLLTAALSIEKDIKLVSSDGSEINQVDSIVANKILGYKAQRNSLAIQNNIYVQINEPNKDTIVNSANPATSISEKKPTAKDKIDSINFTGQQSQDTVQNTLSEIINFKDSINKLLLRKDSIINLNDSINKLLLRKDSIKVSPQILIQGISFKEKPNEVVRIKNNKKNYDYGGGNQKYYPDSGSIDLDSLSLGNDFIIETEVKSFNNTSSPYGLIYNGPGSIEGTGYFYLYFYDGARSAKVCAGINRDTTSRYYYEEKFEKKLFSESVSINLTDFHKLRINKVGDNLEFYLDGTNIHSTKESQIELKKFKFLLTPWEIAHFDTYEHIIKFVMYLSISTINKIIKK